MGKTIASLNKDYCTGCGACYNVCSQQAIRMQENIEGFLEPTIINELCINCCQCYNVCPQIGEKIHWKQTNKLYAVRCYDSIRDICSSGGFFGAVSEWTIANHGIVFGAAFSQDYKKVIHVKIKEKEKLKKIYKSKYLQSDTSFIYKEVKNELENTSAPIVFVGCPCQVEGLQLFLGKEYNNLITIDLLCHGVVSPKAYRIFLNDFFGDVDSPIKNVDFRSKELGWACNVVVVAEDGTKRISPYKGDYFNAFLWGYSQRKVCFTCKYANPQRVGDISIGDFWGIEHVFPAINDKKGISLVLSNSSKGENIIPRLNLYIDQIHECKYQSTLEAIKDINWALYKPGIIPANRDIFFYRLNQGDTFSQAFRYASCSQYDVGIFGWWFEDDWTNYGSTLTYYALMEYVSSLGLSVCMITSPFHKREEASAFIKKHGYVMSKTYNFSEFAKHNENIDTFLIGSDQLWFYNCYKPWGHSLFLDFVKDNKKKIAYATSFGHRNPKIPDEEIPELKKLLGRFDAISNREFDGVDIMAEKFGLNSTQTIDPVFLCNIGNWKKIADEAGRKTEGDFIFAYILDPDEEKLKALDFIFSKMGIRVVSITDKQYDNADKIKQMQKYGILIHATIEEQIYHLMNAKYVVTDSYHGTCFAILFRRNFVSIVNAQRGTSRFETIAKLFDVGNRFIYKPDELYDRNDLFVRPNYSHITPLVKKEIARSKAWLNDKILSRNILPPPTHWK